MARLTRNNWIQYGLTVLGAEGHSNLKAGALAKRLRVTRRSFYWHSADLDAYHGALLAHRHAKTARANSQQDPSSAPGAMLVQLMLMAAHGDMALERAFRAWGWAIPENGAQIEHLGTLRLSILRGILARTIPDQAQAEARAKFISAAAIGLMELGEDKVGLRASDLDAVADALLRTDMA